MIKYDALWETMKKKNVSQYVLINKYNISRGLIHRLKNGVDYICTELVCIYEKLEINDAEKKKTIEKYLRLAFFMSDLFIRKTNNKIIDDYYRKCIDSKINWYE